MLILPILKTTMQRECAIVANWLTELAEQSAALPSDDKDISS